MEISKIIGVGIIGAFLTVTVKSYRPELGMGVAGVTGVVIFAMLLPGARKLLEDIYALAGASEVSLEYVKTVTKIIGIAYITQFAAELAKDSGEGAISKKIEFAGKISVLTLMIPIVRGLLDAVINALMSF